MNPTEFLLLVAWPALCFGIGVWAGPGIRNLALRKKRLVEVSNQKPLNEFSHYTIDELEAHKRYLQREYTDSVHYPYIRQSAAEGLKKVLTLLDWHYTVNGTYDLHTQRERVKQDLADFDEQYQAALKDLR